MEIMNSSLVEYGVANFALPGEGTSGDCHVLRARSSGLLVAAIDGIGHGEEAANAAKTAASICPMAPINQSSRSSRSVIARYSPLAVWCSALPRSISTTA